MPLSGEAIRMMNYIDDISTTLRRILALSPTLSAEERKRVGEYLKVELAQRRRGDGGPEPQIKQNRNRGRNLYFWNKQARKPVSG